ncbi:MAG: alanine:cation symporter family protein [Spirochaetaceae bacterium]|nr:alanine:cation symporter family protein [Spirochaetaceae bacterium]MCF7949391.1 alanine:cation symporter family protein [Spirochaetia bacterium]MCF7952117.1 alanine:cation symporter family protein [Spirochaetaceae bacterium]
MQAIEKAVAAAGSFAWGPVIITILFVAGIILTVGTKIVQYRRIGKAFKYLFAKDVKGEGDINPFAALMTTLSATIGTGNIGGVATAIAAGGPGAVFWMWVTAVFGGAIKFAEAVLAVRYRTTDEFGEKSGGPMYYASVGMEERYGGNWKWLGWLFALFAFVASFGIGNMVQSNAIADVMDSSLGIPTWISGLVVAVLVGLVVIGGIKRIARVAEKIVPFMAVIYVLGSLFVIFANIEFLPRAFGWIFGNAFNGRAVAGGFLGSVVRFGVARGVFSNEAGLGSAPIAHAASRTEDPVRQGLIASLGSFLDTIVVCTMTALVIFISPVIKIGPDGMMNVLNNLDGASLTSTAYNMALPGGFGQLIVSFGLLLFAFTTILTWYYYGYKSLEFITGEKIAAYYKYVWVVLVFVGAIASLGFVWNLSDAFNGLMILPNLIALIALSGVVFKMLREYEEKYYKK